MKSIKKGGARIGVQWSGSQREHNRQQLLWQFLEHGALSRGGLAGRTGLSAVTVNLITRALEDQGLIIEIGKTEGAAGRPASILDLHPQLGTLVGIDCQPGEIHLLTGDIRGHQRQRTLLQAFRSEELHAQLMAEVAELLRSAPHGPVRHITVSVPAPVSGAGQMGEPNSLPQLDLAPLQEVAARSGADIVLENDANLWALAEKYDGAASDEDDFMVLVQRRSGIGLGLYLGGTVYRGTNGMAGELALARWPHQAWPTPIEQLPEALKQAALAYLVGAVAASLDLRLVIVTDDAQSSGQDIIQSLQHLAPQLCVVRSHLGPSGSVLGALTASRLRYAASLLSSSAAPALSLNSAPESSLLALSPTHLYRRLS
ncbi:ROK family protein [Deinococcus detaillensis]|uniref:ROK family protein n=1 Tax=Deinococcus detaillensis TaxID=2592048 RepID=A0A553UJI0_9DEIO|nr:ROK family protein [Deinococcus detaillensis]